MKKVNKSQVIDMKRILVPGFVFDDLFTSTGQHFKTEVVSKEEWNQNSNQSFDWGSVAHMKFITTTFADEANYNMGLITKEQFEANQPIVKVEYKKWYLPHIPKDIYNHIIAVSEQN